MRNFATKADADSYIEHTRPGSVRWVGRCAGCGTGCAVSVPGSWEARQDLFGRFEVFLVSVRRPEGDPCSHGAMRWERVRWSPGVMEACNEGCRDALGADCSCSCFARNHGANHRVRNPVPLSSET